MYGNNTLGGGGGGYAAAKVAVGVWCNNPHVVRLGNGFFACITLVAVGLKLFFSFDTNISWK